jgi:hypothetical protein
MMTIIDVCVIFLIATFAISQAWEESKKNAKFWVDFLIWLVASYLAVILGFKIFDRLTSDPASFLDLFMHSAFLALAARHYFLTRRLTREKNVV